MGKTENYEEVDPLPQVAFSADSICLLVAPHLADLQVMSPHHTPQGESLAATAHWIRQR